MQHATYNMRTYTPQIVVMKLKRREKVEIPQVENKLQTNATSVCATFLPKKMYCHTLLPSIMALSF